MPLPYRQLRNHVAALEEARIHEIIALGTRTGADMRAAA